MAKLAKAAATRIASTVTARYSPTSGATDAFYLDGRISGRREQRAADITLDREDRGFFFAVYAHTGGTGPDDTASGRAKRALDRMHQAIKQVGRNIDSEINDLADTAVEVAGRITLQHDSVRQPYFAGVVIRDSELAAITMGGGCAYLYRNDVLYPLTTDDYALEPIDRDGNPVERLNVYCAGVAGTVRYSNIAQLQVDDCIIVCNRELMEAVGQREMLRLLDEAEDQCDAAGLIMMAASAKVPATSFQLMISFIEGISAGERPARFANGRVAAEALAPIIPIIPAKIRAVSDESASGAMKPETVSAASAFGRDDRLSRQQTNFSEQEKEPPFEDGGMAYGDIDSAGRGKRIAFYVIIAIVCMGSLFAIYSMLFKKPSPTSTTTAITTKAQTSATSTTITSSGTTATTKTGTTSAGGTTLPGAITLPAKHTVVSGDTISSIATKYYGASSPALWDLIRKANSLTSDNLKIGQILTIPVKA